MTLEVAMIGGESLDVQSLRIPCGMKWLWHRGPSFRHILQTPTLGIDLFRLDIHLDHCKSYRSFKDIPNVRLASARTNLNQISRSARTACGLWNLTCFAPISKVSALKCRDATESSAFEFACDVIRLITAD